MFISQGDSLVKQNTFIADSGASTHIVHSKQFLTDFQPEEGDVKIGDNKTIKSLGEGTLTLTPIIKSPYYTTRRSFGSRFMGKFVFSYKSHGKQ
jgi:hypothetical protein